MTKPGKFIIAAFILLAPGFLGGQPTHGLDKITSQFNEMVTTLYQEKVFIHTDKPFYFTGETLWFKAYCVDATTHRPIGISTVLYLELIDPEGNSLDQKMISLQDGRGWGQFEINERYQSKAYTLRAYTAWMKNFDHRFFFEKKLIVINPEAPLAGNDSSQIVISPEISPTEPRVDLPGGTAEDPALEVKYLADQGQYEVTLKANPPGEATYLFVQSRGVICYTGANQGAYLIPKTQLLPGINHFTLFNAHLEPVSERLVFVRPDSRSDISIQPDKKSYHKREKVTVAIGFNDGHPDPEMVDLSLSVYQTHGALDLKTNGIESYLLLGADLSTPIQETDNYFIHPTDSLTLQLDSLLLTESWTRFNWQNVLNGKRYEITHLPEASGPILKGTVPNEAIEGSRLNVFFPGQSPSFVTTTPIQDQSFYVQLPQGNAATYMLFHSSYAPVSGLQLDPPYVPGISPTASNLVLDESLRDFITAYYLHNQVTDVYSQTGNDERPTAAETASYPFYGQAEFTYHLDNYTRFKSMREVFAEVIRHFKSRKTDGVEHLYTRDLYRNMYTDSKSHLFNVPALVMIDGVPIDDLQTILNFNPLLVKSIDVVTRPLVAETRRFYGVINLKTYKGDLGGMELPENLVSQQYGGLAVANTFSILNYEKAPGNLNRIPDFRSVLLWEPDIMMGMEGSLELEFFTSDVEGEYVIEINGISENGKPIHGISKITVQNEN